MVTTSLITAAQQADKAERVTFMPKMGAVVIGLNNQVLVREVRTLDQATDALRALGLAPRRAWDAGLYGSHSVDVFRTN
jgi:hypothetical protein